MSKPREKMRAHRAQLTEVIEQLDQAMEQSQDDAERARIRSERERYEAELSQALDEHACPLAVGDAIAGLTSGKNHLVLLEGDEVRVVSAIDQLVPIESDEAAVVALWLQDRGVRLADAQVRRVAGGFEVTATASEQESLGGREDGDECRVPTVYRYYREVLFVSMEGSVRSVGRELPSQSVGSEDVCHTYGRRTEGARSPMSTRTLAEFLQRAADEEAEAVVAFERLAAELRHHGASPALIDAALEAADDERRHAAMVIALGAELSAL